MELETIPYSRMGPLVIPKMSPKVSDEPIGVQEILAKDDVAPQLIKAEPFGLPCIDAHGDPCLC